MIFFRGNFGQHLRAATIITIVAVAAMLAFVGGPTAAQSASPEKTLATSTSSASTPTPNNTPSRALNPSATATPQPRGAAAVAPTDPQTILTYLSDLISWYRHLGVETELVEEPYETLFLANSRQIANEVLNLGFEYARAQANFIARTTGRTDTGTGKAADPSESARSNEL